MNKKIVLTSLLTLICSNSYSAEIKNTFEFGYKKIDIDKKQETGPENSFRLHDEADGYYGKYALKINNTTLSIDHESIKDNGTNHEEYTGTQIDPDKKLLEYNITGIYLSQDFDIDIANITLTPKVGYKYVDISDNNIPYPESLNEDYEKFNLYNASLKISTSKNISYFNPYIMAEYQNSDLKDKNEVRDTKDDFIAESTIYSVGTDIEIKKNLSLHLKYSYVYENNAYNENLTAGKYLTSDSLSLGLKYTIK